MISMACVYKNPSSLWRSDSEANRNHSCCLPLSVYAGAATRISRLIDILNSSLRNCGTVVFNGTSEGTDGGAEVTSQLSKGISNAPQDTPVKGQ